MLNQRYSIQISRVIDGDTIQGTIQLPWAISMSNRIVRLLDYDAWETRHPASDDEIAKGLVAKTTLQGLIKQIPIAVIETGLRSFDDFGRVLGRLILINEKGVELNIADYMKQNGHTKIKIAKFDPSFPIDGEI